MGVRYGAAIDFLAGLRREWGTHLHADDSGWQFPASYGDAMSAVLAQAYLAVHRDPKKPKTEMPFPWTPAPVIFSAAEVAEAERILAMRVVIPDD